MGSYLTPKQVAELLQVPTDTVRFWINVGELEAVNVGNGSKRPRWRIYQDAIDKFRKRRTRSTSEQGQPRRKKAPSNAKQFF